MEREKLIKLFDEAIISSNTDKQKLNEVEKIIKNNHSLIFKLHTRYKLFDFILSVIDKDKLINTFDKYGNNFLYYCNDETFLITKKYFTEEQIKKMVNHINYTGFSFGTSPNVDITLWFNYINKKTFMDACSSYFAQNYHKISDNFLQNYHKDNFLQNYHTYEFLSSNDIMIRFYNSIILDMYHETCDFIDLQIEHVIALLNNGANVHTEVSILNYKKMPLIEALVYDFNIEAFNGEKLKSIHKKIYESLHVEIISNSKSANKFNCGQIKYF